jgi:hypothetical protein
MNLQVVYNKEAPTNKWIVWKRNIGEKYFYCMECFSDRTLKALIGTKPNDKVNGPEFYNTPIAYVNTLKNDQSKVKDKGNASTIVPTDTYRNMTIFEYICLGFILKKGNVKYNKKKDEFINVE